VQSIAAEGLVPFQRPEQELFLFFFRNERLRTPPFSSAKIVEPPSPCRESSSRTAYFLFFQERGY